jgi:hypothetical protein
VITQIRSTGCIDVLEGVNADMLCNITEVELDNLRQCCVNAMLFRESIFKK